MSSLARRKQSAGPQANAHRGHSGSIEARLTSRRVAGVRLPSSKGNSFSMDGHGWSNKMEGMRCYLSNPKHSGWSPVAFASETLSQGVLPAPGKLTADLGQLTLCS